jgi:hypothetical protein
MTTASQCIQLITAGDADWLSQDVPTLLVRPAPSFEQFVSDHASVFA